MSLGRFGISMSAIRNAVAKAKAAEAAKVNAGIAKVKTELKASELKATLDAQNKVRQAEKEAAIQIAAAELEAAAIIKDAEDRKRLELKTFTEKSISREVFELPAEEEEKVVVEKKPINKKTVLAIGAAIAAAAAAAVMG